jgi:hypothetical protein
LGTDENSLGEGLDYNADILKKGVFQVADL